MINLFTTVTGSIAAFAATPVTSFVTAAVSFTAAGTATGTISGTASAVDSANQAGVRFESPLWLIAIPVLLVLLVVFTRRLQNSFLREFDTISKLNRHIFWYPSFSQQDTRSRTAAPTDERRTIWQVLHRLVPLVLVFLSLSCFFLALAEPVMPGKKWPVKAGQRPVLLLVDTSISMMQKDYVVGGKSVQRIEFVRLVSKHLLEKFRGDRVAMILFSEKTAVLFPFTSDHQLQLKQLKRVDTELTGRSNFPGRAMAFSIRFLQTWQRHWPGANKPEIILLTHGARPLGRFDAQEMAAIMSHHGYRLHTVGIGGSTDQGGNNRLAKGLDYDPVNKPLLRRLAARTGGQFVHATRPADVDAIIKVIRSRTRAVDTIAWIQKTRPLYFWPVLAGIALLASAYLWRTLTASGNAKRVA